MKPVRIFRHIDCEGPGYFAQFLQSRQIPWELVAIDENQPVRTSLDDVSGLVFMGGPMSVNDDIDWLRDELALIAAAAQRRIPLLGHCLGGQLISKALGGNVGPNPVKEIGWHPVNVIHHPFWTEGIPSRFTPYHWHGETFSLPNGADLVLSNINCSHQAFARENILALQCHVEMTEDMVRQWATRYADEISEAKGQNPASVQSYDEQNLGLSRRIRDSQSVAERLYEKWVSFLR